MDIKPNNSAISQYAKEFASSSVETIFENKHFVSGKELVNATDVKQVNLFLVRIIYEQWQAQTAQLVSPYFDYSSKEVKEALNTFMSLLSKNIKIAKDDLEILIEQAVEDTLVLSISPMSFFNKFLEQFEKKINIKKQIKPTVQYFITHPTECNTFFEALKAKGAKITKENAFQTLEEVFQNTDSFSPDENTIQTFNQTLPLTLSQIVDGIEEEIEREPSNILEETSFDLSGLGIDSNDGEESYEFEDLENSDSPSKKGEGHVDELESILKDKPEEKVEVKAEEENTSPLIDEIAEKPDLPVEKKDAETKVQDTDQFDVPASEETTMPEINEPAVETQESFETDTVSETPDPQLDPAVIEETTPQVEQASVPATSASASQDEEVESNTLLEKLGGTTEEENEEEENEQDSDSSYYQSLLDKLGHSKKSDIRSSLSLNMKFRYQNELFNGDNAEFNNALDLIEQCSDYEKAMGLLKTKYMRTYNWDVSDDTTKEFLTMVSNHF